MAAAAGTDLDVQAARTAAVALVAEAALLRRMLYKNANQHRHALFYQRLVGLRRAVDRMLPARLVGCVEDSIAALRTLEAGAVGEGLLDSQSNQFAHEDCARTSRVSSSRWSAAPAVDEWP